MHSKIAHIAIIMDGNGRWAQKRGMPRIAGHEAGSRVTRRIVELVKDRDIPYLTLYAFSSENWRRPQEEIEGLFNLLERFIDEQIDDMQAKGVCLHIIGDITRLPVKLQKKIHHTMDLTRDNSSIHLTIALNYGGRDEILRALSAWKADGEPRVDEEGFKRYLDTAGMPDPDLLIRTGEEKRISNFLLWQIAYAEIYFTDILWPDFDEKALDDAIAWFASRQRRFGMTGEQASQRQDP